MTPTKSKQANGLQGSLKLAGETFEQATTRVHEFHRAISDMPFKAVGAATLSASKPIEGVHNELTDLVYSVVKETGKGLFGGAAMLAEAASVSNVSVKSAQRLSVLSSAIHGIVGDHLAVSRNPIQIKAGFYQDCRLVDLSPEGLALAYPQATGHLVVFAHGLCCDESVWNMYSEPGNAQTAPYAEKLRSKFEVTPLFLRYNTGLSIDSNGRRYRRLLKRLITNWPVPVESLTLVGHSMGGLIGRVAVQDMGPGDELLSSVLKDVISLGSPYTGSPVARLAGAGEALLNGFELSRPISKVLGVRSTGIRNLQKGLGPLKTSDGLPINFHLMGATMSDNAGSWVTETLGDGLVQMSSALADESGRAQRLAFASKHHMRLVNDHEIYQQIEAVIRQNLQPKD